MCGLCITATRYQGIGYPGYLLVFLVLAWPKSPSTLSPPRAKHYFLYWNAPHAGSPIYLFQNLLLHPTDCEILQSWGCFAVCPQAPRLALDRWVF